MMLTFVCGRLTCRFLPEADGEMKQLVYERQEKS